MVYPWNSPGKSTRVGTHSLLQEIFPTQEWNLHPQCLLHCRQTLYHWATREIHNNPYQQLITWNQNGHIKESNLVMKCSLRRILGKCSWNLLESVFNWVVSVAHKFIFFQKTAREVVSLYLSPSFSEKKKIANRIKWFVHNKYALPWTVYYIESQNKGFTNVYYWVLYWILETESAPNIFNPEYFHIFRALKDIRNALSPCIIDINSSLYNKLFWKWSKNNF